MKGWIETPARNVQINKNLICEIHSKMTAKAGDDHCAPGKIRPQDNNVTFGRPQHRGAEGGKVCELAFNNFIQAISVSNYYYEEKDAYLDSLNAVREQGYDVSPFLKFGLRGTALQCKRLLKEIKHHVSKSLFRDTMNDLFEKLETSHKRVIGKRQIEIEVSTQGS